MLTRLAIKNFVLVKELDIDLASGFTALSGETGAGKSILIDAIQLLLGARANGDFIGPFAAQTELVGEFSLSAQAKAWLADNGYAAEEDELLVRRLIDNQGRSKIWLNASITSAQQLKQLAPLLINIHGQHAWQNLLAPAGMRLILDSYAKIDLQPLAQLWHRWQESEKQLLQLQQENDFLSEQLENLRWKIAEVSALAPAAGEWEEIAGEHSKLAHSAAILQACAVTLESLDGENNPANAFRLLNAAVKELSPQQQYEPEFTNIIDILEQSKTLLQEASYSLSHYLSNNEPEPQRLSYLDSRISSWLGLAKRFNLPPEQLYAAWQQWQEQLKELSASADLTVQQQLCTKLKQQWQEVAEQISTRRRQAAPQLAAQVTALLHDLAMPQGQFAVSLTPTQPSSYGLEQVEFLVAAHPGMAPGPIQKIASGGELSRIALAISAIESNTTAAQCLIFDEIDAGIGGEVANTVGLLMRRLGSNKQVLCVTHLAQVASYATQQLSVTKTIGAKQTLTQVIPLNTEQRITEIARMLSGHATSETALAHARQLLNSAQQP